MASSSLQTHFFFNSHFSFSSSSQPFFFFNPSLHSLQTPPLYHKTKPINPSTTTRLCSSKPRSTLDEKDPLTTPPSLLQRESHTGKGGVEESVKVLKNAAKTRKVPPEEVLAALAVIKKAKLDSSGFLDTLGGTESPGRTWMLIFTALKRLESGRYFPITAVQRFDAAGKRIENGVFLGPIGSLTFEGRLSWKKRILAFIFENIRIKIGPFGPLQISLGQIEEREPSNKDPFFIWFYVDEEIAVAEGKSGGTAFWCRCRRVK